VGKKGPHGRYDGAGGWGLSCHPLARAIRRVILGALVDRHADLAETRQQLRMLVGTHATHRL